MSNKNILVVDDKESICLMMREMITRKFSNITVECASNSKEAVEEIKSGNYDLVFLDVKLGEIIMNGIEILKFIKGIKPEQKVCMITGYEVDDEKVKIVEDKSVGLLYKPFKLDELFKIIEDYVLV